jgi:redox-sensitive bicupin YhaK (pirin superfamily)
MGSVRRIKEILMSKPTVEGAGVHLKRAFGYYEVPRFDPFLLLDYFGSENPDDYLAGFPWHPHRGIETVTYMLHGSVEHGDSMGNKGVIESGDIQWMTAGSGIIHQEMPKKTRGRMRGLQLWVNLPASRKMMDPRYQEITADMVPEVGIGGGVRVKIIAGEFDGHTGPVREIVSDPRYLDVDLPPGASFEIPIRPGHRVFAFVLDGQGTFGEDSSNKVDEGNAVLFEDGEGIRAAASAKTSDAGFRFLLVSGKPIGEPVAWRGPIVMNTDEELLTAFEEYRRGTFIKNRS